MPSIPRILAVAVALLILTACGGSQDPAGGTANDEPAETVFDPLTDTLDRAAGVEDTLREAAEERRRQLEEQE